LDDFHQFFNKFHSRAFTIYGKKVALAWKARATWPILMLNKTDLKSVY